MGCCAQTNLGQNAFNLNVPGIRFDPSQRMNQREIVDKREVSGENFIRISIYHKTLGKEHFMKKEFAQAVIEYSKAINYCPQISVYYSNRALCYKAQHEWNKALEDSRQAVILDENNIKALDIMAEALIELERRDPKKSESLSEAVKTFEKAHSLALDKKGDEIAESIAKELDLKLKRARKMLYLKQQITHQQKKEDTSQFIKKIIEKNEKDQSKKREYLELFQELVKEKETHKIETPDYLNCKISYEVMKDPKMTPDGISYEGNVLNEHFIRVGYFDPVTRREVDSTMLIPNYSLKKAIDHFYIQHPNNFEPEKKNVMEISI